MDKLEQRSKISKIAKFESDLLKTNEDTAPQSREILQTFEELYPFAHLRRITFKFGNFTDLKALFSVVSTDLP